MLTRNGIFLRFCQFAQLSRICSTPKPYLNTLRTSSSVTGSILSQMLGTFSDQISFLSPVGPNFTFFHPSVAGVTENSVLYTARGPDGQMEQHTIPTNFTLWSTGIAMNPFAKRVTDLLPNQVHKKAIEVDAHLRVKGAPLGSIYAVGDCATVCIKGFCCFFGTENVYLRL